MMLFYYIFSAMEYVYIRGTISSQYQTEISLQSFESSKPDLDACSTFVIVVLFPILKYVIGPDDVLS